MPMGDVDYVGAINVVEILVGFFGQHLGEPDLLCMVMLVFGVIALYNKFG